MKTLTLDKYDVAILNALHEDSRRSWVDLAEAVHLSPSACQRRTQTMRELGVIARYTIDVDTELMGYDVEAFVAVNIERQQGEHAAAFRARMLALPQIQSCFMLSGSIDFMLRVVARNLREFGQFIQEELLSLPGVKDATSSLVLECIKRDQSLPPQTTP
ncbi:MAG: Lrp/AsnC family transcriptional regulator [Pseudomonadota bacterium]